ncbi:hypothetical protein H0A66_13480 [Alcaligenaceae bacterium]|nr:hypothetical protein [Alcaligenaceae bacterium]
MKLQADIDKLRTTLLQTTDFSKAWNDFFDIAGKQQFVARSRQARLELLEPLLYEISLALAAGSQTRLEAPLILRYAHTDFYHGPLTCGVNSGTFMYFQKLGAGMAALFDAASGQVNFCRVNLAIVSSPHCFTATPSEIGFEGPSVH